LRDPFRTTHSKMPFGFLASLVTRGVAAAAIAGGAAAARKQQQQQQLALAQAQGRVRTVVAMAAPVDGQVPLVMSAPAPYMAMNEDFGNLCVLYPDATCSCMFTGHAHGTTRKSVGAD
jgi:hypothetical protein